MMAHTVSPHQDYDKALENPQEAGSFDIVREHVNDNSDTIYNFSKRGVLLLTRKNVDKWGKNGCTYHDSFSGGY